MLPIPNHSASRPATRQADSASSNQETCRHFSHTNPYPWTRVPHPTADGFFYSQNPMGKSNHTLHQPFIITTSIPRFINPFSSSSSFTFQNSPFHQPLFFSTLQISMDIIPSSSSSLDLTMAPPASGKLVDFFYFCLLSNLLSFGCWIFFLLFILLLMGYLHFSKKWFKWSGVPSKLENKDKNHLKKIKEKTYFSSSFF